MLPDSGAFSPLGALPRRTHKRPTFHFNDDDGSSSNELSSTAVPFPLTSPLHSPPLTRPPPLLKPLKSSLKSSSSSPNIPFPAQSLVPSIMFPDLHPKQQLQHQRASSAPSTPLFISPPSTTTTSSSSSSSSSPPPSSPHVSKNVHFPSQEGGLATIRLFNRSARPASLSRLGEETETDTDGEAATSSTYYAGSGGWQGWSGKYVGGSTFPFPRIPPAEKKSPLNPSKLKRILYNIDWSASSVIPRKNVDRGNENVFFESLQVVDGGDNETELQGSLLVRNITYQKTVMVRYTMDEWETLNDVLAWYDGKNGNGSWDRFKFSVSLSGQRLQDRIVWLVGKYAGGGGADKGGGDAVEWWDNNEGKNYRVAFKEAAVDQPDVYKRGVAVSAPTTYTSPTPTPISRPNVSDPHHAAITQGTLARLKKLNLKNYAAPRGYHGYNTPSPPVLTLTSASPTTSSFVRHSGLSSSSSSPPPPLESPRTPNLTLNTTLEVSSPTLSSASTVSTLMTSTDSTPVQTPTQDDEEDEDDGDEKRWKVGRGEEEERLRWSLGMESGHFATTILPSPPISSSSSLSSSPTTLTPLGSPNIPVSIPGDRNTFSYPTKAGGVEMGTSPPFSDLKESVIGRAAGGGGGFVRWDWGTAAGGVALNGVGEGKKEKPAYDSINGGSGLMFPPQRKRGLQQQKRGTSLSSSGSDSNSKNSKLSLSSIPTTPTLPPSTVITPLKQKPKPPKLDLPTPTLTRPPSDTSPSGVQSPNIRRGLGGYNSPSPTLQQQPQRHGGHRYYQSMPSFLGSNSSKSPSTTSGGDSDPIYQALVREWCFAQGPPPSSPISGETTPVLVVNRPSPLGLTCALGDGE